MSKPITVDEICTINSTDIFKVNQLRKKLGITQVFLAKCADIPYATFNKMIHQGEQIPEKYIDPLIDALVGLYYVAEGRKVLPVKKKHRDDGKTSAMEDVLTFLVEIQDPQISASAIINDSKENIFNDVLQTWAFRAEELADKILEETDG